jgi:signal transduction histidine kinase
MDPNQEKIYLAVLISLCILVFFIFFFVISIIRHQKRKLISHEEKMRDEIILLEKERARLSSDLHDELSPMLSAIKLQLECVEPPTDDDKEILEKTGKYIDHTIQKVREISNAVMPYTLQRNGLEAALGEYLNMINQVGKVNVTLENRLPAKIEDKDLQVHLYRITQEIVNNAVKHANASSIAVKLLNAKEKLVIDIQDNGKGFNDEEVAKFGKGLGLRNIMARVDILKGTVYLDTAKNKGTHYSIEIPFVS